MVNKKLCLVTGGAGYIGSHTVRKLLENKFDAVIADNLSKGHRQSLPKDVNFYKLDVGNKKSLRKIFRKYKIDAVMHFAGFIEAGESMAKPAEYYKNNVVNTLKLLDVMLEFNAKKIVFSSSAAVYGESELPKLTEKSELRPTNVYGRTKLMVESILKDYDLAYGVKSMCLRYFNAAGAGYGIGEDHKPESHLIPRLMRAALGHKRQMKIFGTKYKTRDGTCIRDYVHVVDLAQAHVLALKRLLKNSKSEIYNVGSEKGHSVREVIDVAKEITKASFDIEEAKARPGDTPVLVADSSKIRKELGWNPKFELKGIVKSAFEWHKNNPEGFK